MIFHATNHDPCYAGSQGYLKQSISYILLRTLYPHAILVLPAFLSRNVNLFCSFLIGAGTGYRFIIALNRGKILMLFCFQKDAKQRCDITALSCSPWSELHLQSHDI